MQYSNANRNIQHTWLWIWTVTGGTVGEVEATRSSKNRMALFELFSNLVKNFIFYFFRTAKYYHFTSSAVYYERKVYVGDDYYPEIFDPLATRSAWNSWGTAGI